jgi:PAS domain S-box-containing protein
MDLSELWGAGREPVVLWQSADVATRAVLREAFDRTGVQAIEVEEGCDVAAAFLSVLPDIVLVDCRQASARHETCAQLRSARGRDWRPVVGIVGGEDDGALVAASERGFDDLLCPPLRPDLVTRRIAVLLRERQARESLRLLSECALLSPTATGLWDVRSPERPIVFLNPAFEGLTGFRAAELTGRQLPRPRGAGPDAFAEAFEDAARGVPQRVVAQMLRRDGSRFWADTATAPIPDAGGRVTHVAVAVSVVDADLAPGSPRTDSQGAVHRRRFTEALLNHITTGVITADSNVRVSFANRTALEALGLKSEACLKRDVLEVFGHSERLLQALRDVADGGETRADFSVAHSSGRRLDVGMTIVRPRAGAPPDMAYVLLFRDLDDRRQFEMELRRVERLSAIGNMVAGFAHEVRNPLAGIQALAETLQAEMPKEDPRREYPARILALLARVERLIKGSLHFGEPKAPVFGRHAAAGLVATALEALAPRWRGRPAPAVVAAEPAPAVETDHGQIVECLLALLENALEAAGDPARVQVSVHAEADAQLIEGAPRVVLLDVRDQGPGIPEADLSRIFDPFFTTKPKGTGLGLAVAQALVRENGGRLLVRSRPGETVFSLVLPEAQS